MNAKKINANDRNVSPGIGILQNTMVKAGDFNPLVDDVATIASGKVGHRTFDNPGLIGNLPRLQAVVQRGHIGPGRRGQALCMQGLRKDNG